MDVSALLKVKGSEVLTIDGERPIADAIAALDSNNVGSLVVSDGSLAIVGILSERDVVRHLNRLGPALLEHPVSSVATSPVYTCGLSDAVTALMAVMTTRRFRHVPVVDDGRLVGIVSIGDIVKNRLAELELANNQLESYITGVPR